MNEIKTLGTKFWAVWNPNGRIPKFEHETEKQADTEARRLAELNPGHHFVVLEAKRSFAFKNMVRTTLIDPATMLPKGQRPFVPYNIPSNEPLTPSLDAIQSAFKLIVNNKQTEGIVNITHIWLANPNTWWVGDENNCFAVSTLFKGETAQNIDSLLKVAQSLIPALKMSFPICCELGDKQNPALAFFQYRTTYGKTVSMPPLSLCAPPINIPVPQEYIIEIQEVLTILNTVTILNNVVPNLNINRLVHMGQNQWHLLDKWGNMQEINNIIGGKTLTNIWGLLMKAYPKIKVDLPITFCWVGPGRPQTDQLKEFNAGKHCG